MLDEEKKAIENLKTEYEKLIKEDNILFPLYKSEAKRLIDIIEKQSKEIEELKEDLNKKPIFLIKDLYNRKLKEISLQDAEGLIEQGREDMKDKIKAKIEVLDEAIKVNKECTKDNADRIIVRLLNDEINELKKARNVLQSLLEKE